jgi:hypothetical protein
MARNTLQEIIVQIRLMVGDTAGTPVFSDDNLQSILDSNRVEFNYLVLQGLTIPNTSAAKIFNSPYSWEKSAKFYDSNYAEILPNSNSDFLHGRFEFDANQEIIIFISGFAFDLNNAAADILEAWAAKCKLDFDFGADSQDYKESQKFKMLKDLANSFRAKATLFGVGGLANSAIGTAAFGSTDWNVCQV